MISQNICSSYREFAFWLFIIRIGVGIGIGNVFSVMFRAFGLRIETYECVVDFLHWSHILCSQRYSRIVWKTLDFLWNNKQKIVYFCRKNIIKNGHKSCWNQAAQGFQVYMSCFSYQTFTFGKMSSQSQAKLGSLPHKRTDKTKFSMFINWHRAFSALSTTRHTGKCFYFRKCLFYSFNISSSQHCKFSWGLMRDSVEYAD